MKNPFNFSLCLSQLLNILNISNNKLAKSVNVDPSLVSKWKTGKRRVDKASIYLELISFYLSENVSDSCQIESILALEEKYSLSINIDIYNNTKAYIHKLLVSSLEKPFEERKSNIMVSSPQLTDTIAYGDINCYKIILGHKNVICAGIDLLKSLPEKPYYINDPILITFFTEIDSFSNFEETNVEWNNTLLEVQKKGWCINKLISINENKNRNIKIIDELLQNIETKKYNAYHLNNYNYFFHFREVILVPTIGVLLCLCGNDFDKIDNAFLFTDEQALKAFDLVSKQCLTKAVPLISSSYSNKDINSLIEVLTYEEFNGNRYSFNCFMNYLTTPFKFYQKHLSSSIPNLPKMDLNKLVFYNKKLKEAFKFQVDCYNFDNIYSKKSIEAIVKYCKYNCDNFTPSDGIEILEYFIYLLETYENFNIAYSNDNNLNNLNNFAWIVVESNAVIINNLAKRSENNNKVYVSITEPNIVNAFTDYFQQLWRNIAPMNKDKKSVIAWLKIEIKSLNYISK